MVQGQCPLCEDPAGFSPIPMLPARAKCSRCGEFLVHPFLFENTIDVGLRPYLSMATRQASDEGRCLQIDGNNLQELADSQREIRVTEKIERMLGRIARKAGTPGAPVIVSHREDCFLYSTKSPDELLTYLNHIRERGWVKANMTSEASHCWLTVDGWMHVEPAPTSGGIPGRCFVAMSFDPSLDEAYRFGIGPGIHDCGFDPVCMKDIVTNEGITDRILAEIRLAQFLVADFTGQRHGVYFEAGFAKGLGREVIWTCREDDKERLHFDTKHLGHVLWTDPQDLRTKLAASIRANIIPKR
jgi:hypothetical protein